MLVVALNTASGAALLWLLCRRSARLPLLCRLGFWAGASGLLLHALTLVGNGRGLAQLGPGWLLPAGFWLLALGWWFAPAAIGQAPDTDRTPASSPDADARMDAGGRAASGTKAEELDFTDYTRTRSRHEGHGA